MAINHIAGTVFRLIDCWEPKKRFLPKHGLMFDLREQNILSMRKDTTF